MEKNKPIYADERPFFTSFRPNYTQERKSVAPQAESAFQRSGMATPQLPQVKTILKNYFREIVIMNY